MSILEQDEIDKLQRELANLDQRKDLALRAREKIRAMHLEILGSVCLSDLETLDDIGALISRLDSKILPSTKYYESFLRLKQSYFSRI